MLRAGGTEDPADKMCCVSHPFPLSLALAWELTGEEMLEGLVELPAIVTTVSVGHRGFWYDWAPSIDCAGWSDCPCAKEEMLLVDELQHR